MTNSAVSMPYFDFTAAAERLKGVVVRTPLTRDLYLSAKYGCNVLLKREDLQPVRSYKLRGAYNKISSLSSGEVGRGVVCSSAGNHAQGVAYTCRLLNIPAVIFMPVSTPPQKIRRTRMFGEGVVEIHVVGESFDDCNKHAVLFAEASGMQFIPPFDDLRVIEGQATAGREIIEDIPEADYLFIPVGGGGLAAGVGSYYKTFSPAVKITGVEPAGAASMSAAFQAGMPVTLNHIDGFVDGAAVKRVGDLTLAICRQVLDDIRPVSESAICRAMIDLYNESGIVAEPAGALSVAALDHYMGDIKGKNVVCIISGGNNDLDRIPEVLRRASF